MSDQPVLALTYGEFRCSSCQRIQVVDQRDAPSERIVPGPCPVCGDAPGREYTIVSLMGAVNGQPVDLLASTGVALEISDTHATPEFDPYVITL